MSHMNKLCWNFSGKQCLKAYTICLEQISHMEKTHVVTDCKFQVCTTTTDHFMTVGTRISVVNTCCELESTVQRSCAMWCVCASLQCVRIACNASAVIATVFLSVYLSVRPSHSTVLSRRIKIRSCGFHCQVARSF